MTTFDRPTLGKLIRRQRELTALPLRQVAAAVGISNAYLSQIERDLREHSERVLGAIADQLGLSPDILIAEANPSRSDALAEVVLAIPRDKDLTDLVVGQWSSGPRLSCRDHAANVGRAARARG